MAPLPSGTVTFLFTDIEDSTKLWERYPQAMKSALARHDAILRQVIEANGGQIIKTTGDGIHAVFNTSEQAIIAVISAQQALNAETWGIDPQSVRVRMGLHSGEAELRDGDYYGSESNRAARLMSLAYGGQILVSQATAELVRDKLPAGARLTALGEHRLKGLSRPESIFQLVHPSLSSNFPPLISSNSIPNNLPVQLTSFIGREREIEEIRRLLASARLVTLSGSGGTGKTRLAQEAGGQLLPDFPHGVWLIELAPLSDPAQILPLLAQILGLQEVPFSSLLNQVKDYLRAKKILLLLDNCEHLIAACAQLADDLLHQCAGLKILASSREALGIAGEVAYRIPSLAEGEAIQLFVERARAANSNVNLGSSFMPSIVQICSRLDGIPLAIELAAARVKLLSPEQITARLNDRFRLLIGGSRTALPRQQTLRATIDWSYDLLSEEEKRLLRITSVFAGGWTLDALEAVSEAPNTLELLEQLVNKSLVVAEERGIAMRYALLETIRQYAREKLLDSGMSEAMRVRGRHLDFFVNLAVAAAPRLMGAEMIECMDELELEQDNLRAAVEWAIENDPLSALRMAVLLPTFWGRRLSASEGYVWVKKALVRAQESIHLEGDAALPYLRARSTALLGEGALAFQRGDNLSAYAAQKAGLALARQIGDHSTLAYALALGSTIAGFLGDIDTARSWCEECRALSRQHGLAYVLAMVTGTEVFLAAVMNEPVTIGLPEETIRLARECGNPWALGMALLIVGRLERTAGHWAEAYPLIEEATALFLKNRDRSFHTSSRSEMGHLLRLQGRYAEAAKIYCETIPIFHELGEYAAVAHELECFALIAAEQGHREHAAQLLGAAEALRERLNTDMTSIERREYEKAVSNLRAQTKDKVMTKAWSEGRAMRMEQAIQLALEPDGGG